LRIVITGVTSFSGAWFAKELSCLGHEVFGFSRNLENLSQYQKERIDWIKKNAKSIELISHNSGSFPIKPDVLCLHGTATLDYRDPNFDVAFATESTVAQSLVLAEKLGKPFTVHTGTFSEQDESIGELPRRSFNPYSTSKSQIYEEHKKIFGESNVLKYVMPNPFGVLEPKKFTDYLIRNWAVQKKPIVNSPHYVRDNVPIDLLAKHYAKVVTSIESQEKTNIQPSKYAETVKAFAERYAQNINDRTGMHLEVESASIQEYSEPRIRINRDFCEDTIRDWNENESWDAITEDALKRMREYKDLSL
jgi:UDP-glucose 4-epimerase